MLDKTINKLAVATAVKPKPTVEFVVLGHYAPFYSKKRGANTIDMLCWLRWGDDRIKPLILMAYGDKNIEHALKLEPFKI